MKKPCIYFFATLLASALIIASASAQSASERHRAKEQNKQDEKVFGDEDNMFSSTSVPDKWKNESAVILALKVNYNYYTQGAKYILDETIRERVKLLDKAAVEDYSYFYFTTDNSSGTDMLGFRIIKKDGTVNTVDLSQAVDVESSDNVPSYEILYGGNKVVKYKKIAISNIEPGDIIDYYYQYHDIIQNMTMDRVKATAFPVELAVLPHDFPVVSQKVNFQVERGFYINFASYNGAPELEQAEDVSHRVKVFSFVDNNREKSKTERYEYEYRCEPAIKFQVVYTSESYKDEVNYFLGKPFVPLNQATPDIVQQVANRMALESDATAESDAKEIIKYMKKKHPDVTDNAKYMEYAYYYLRYLKLIKPASTKYQYANDPSHAVSVPGFTFGTSHKDIAAYYAAYYANLRGEFVDGSVSDEYFIKALGYVCRDRKIEYDFLFTVPRSIGTLDNLLLTAETQWVLHIKGSPDVCFYPFDRFRNPNEGISTVEGSEAYIITPNKNSRVVTMDKQRLPTSKYTDNSFSYNLDVTLNPSMDGGATIKRMATVKGLAKNYYYPEVLVEDAYENQDINRYSSSNDEITDDVYVAKIHNDQKRDEAMRKLQASLDEENKERLDKMKEHAENDYSVDSYDNFKLIADGREMDSTTLIFNESFKIKDMVKKVGPNYMVSVGSLIGTQTNIKDTELDRQNDIYLNYPESNNNQIVITIPDGYQVQGLNNLNVNVTNTTGGFISTASVSGNKLTITTQKYYASNFSPKSNWPDMVKFLRAAYDFSQKKVLLKKA